MRRDLGGLSFLLPHATRRGVAPEGSKRSEAAKRRWADPENRRRHASAVKAGKTSAEARERASTAGKKRWADPEERKRQSERIKAVWANPEIRKRHREGMRRGKAAMQ